MSYDRKWIELMVAEVGGILPLLGQDRKKWQMPQTQVWKQAKGEQ